MKTKLIAVAVTTSLLVGCNVTKTIGDGLGSMIDAVVNVMTSPDLPITQLKPAKNERMANVRIEKVAVAGVNGNRSGDSFVNMIESELANINVADQPFFTLVDRATIQRVIAEQKFSTSDLASSSNNVKLGRLVGADAILSANYHISSVERQSYSETRTKCSDKKCKNSYQYSVSCTKRSISANMTPKLSSVETGKILFTKRFSHQASSSKCSDSSIPHRSNAELAGEAVSNIFKEFSQDIAPHTVVLKPTLLEDDDSKLTEQAEQHLDKGIEFAENEWFEEACNEFTQAQSIFANSLAINYNNGLCAEKEGDLDTAEAFYKRAMTTTNDFDDLDPVRSAIKRVKTRRKELIQLAQIDGIKDFL